MHRFAALLALLPLACGDPSAAPGVTVDGGWKGTYECGADSKKISAILDETAAGAVSGEMFLDYQVVVLGNPLLLTGRANVESATRSKDAASYQGHIDVLDNSQGLDDFDFSFELSAAGDRLTGAIETKDAQGQVKQSCPTTLEKTDVAD